MTERADLAIVRQLLNISTDPGGYELGPLLSEVANRFALGGITVDAVGAVSFNNLGLIGSYAITGDLTLDATQKAYFDGVAGVGSATYLVESSAGVFDAVVGGATSLSLTATAATFVGDVKIPATAKLFPDGGGDSYLQQVSASPDTVRWVIGNVEVLRYVAGGLVFVNDTANAKMTTGLTINQGAADDEILALKSSDVAHGVTDDAETDTYALFKKASATAGGLRIGSYSESNFSIVVDGVVTSADTTKSTAALAPVVINGALKSGTASAVVSADGNLLVVRNLSTARFVLDGDGDSHQDVGTAWTNFDDGDDLARMEAVAVALARPDDPLRGAFVQSFEHERAVIEAMPGKRLIAFDDDGHHFVNMSRLTMLHHGAIRQLGAVLAETRAQLHGLERKVLHG